MTLIVFTGLFVKKKIKVQVKEMFQKVEETVFKIHHRTEKWGKTGKERRPDFPCRSLFQYRFRQDDSFGWLQRDLRGLQLFVKDLLVLAVPLLLLLLLALPVGFIPVQLVLWLGVQLLWQERLQGEAKSTESVTLEQSHSCISALCSHYQSFIGFWWRTGRSHHPFILIKESADL